MTLLLLALAGIYLYALAAVLHTPVIGGVQRWLRKGWRANLIGCPWCSGFWLATALTLIHSATVNNWDWVGTPLTVLAVAAIIGLVGSNWMPPMEEPEDD